MSKVYYIPTITTHESYYLKQYNTYSSAYTYIYINLKSNKIFYHFNTSIRIRKKMFSLQVK